MTKSLSIASVTTAHNSAAVLPRQLDALLRQSRRLQRIIVVNNASTDDTLKVISTRYPQVDVLNLPANVGVGGGFAAGLDYASKEMKHDWVWLLDDDSVPQDDALESLMREVAVVDEQRERVGLLASVPVHSETQLSYPGLLWRDGWVTPPPDSIRQPMCFVDAVISSGSLVRSEVIESVGLPRADFFMDFVDFEYCLRLRRNGYRIGVVRDSLLNHSIGNPRAVNIFGHSRTWADHAPWREYYMSRNQTYTIWTNYPNWRSKLYILRKLLRHGTGILAFGRNKIACLQLMMLGFADGRAKRLGIRFVPDGNHSATSTRSKPFLEVDSTPE